MYTYWGPRDGNNVIHGLSDLASYLSCDLQEPEGNQSVQILQTTVTWC